MDFEVFSVTQDTLHRFERVAAEAFDDDIDTDLLQAFVADPSHHMVCAFADNMVMGQARGVLVRNPDGPPSLYIDNVGVAPRWIGKGVATALLDALIGWGKSQGATSSWVLTETDNTIAVGLYNKLGLAHRRVMICESAE